MHNICIFFLEGHITAYSTACHFTQASVCQNGYKIFSGDSIHQIQQYLWSKGRSSINCIQSRIVHTMQQYLMICHCIILCDIITPYGFSIYSANGLLPVIDNFPYECLGLTEVTDLMSCMLIHSNNMGQLLSPCVVYTSMAWLHIGYWKTTACGQVSAYGIKLDRLQLCEDIGDMNKCISQYHQVNGWQNCQLHYI